MTQTRENKLSLYILIATVTCANLACFDIPVSYGSLAVKLFRCSRLIDMVY